MQELLLLTPFVHRAIIELEKLLLVYNEYLSQNLDTQNLLDEMNGLILKHNSNLKTYRSKLKKLTNPNNSKDKKNYMLELLQTKSLVSLLAEYDYLRNICKEIIKNP